MEPSRPRVDEHGFPIPATFDSSFVQDEPIRVLPRSRKVQVALFLLVVALAIGIVYGPTAWSRGKVGLAESLKQQAVMKYQGDDFAGAVKQLDRAVALNPTDGELYYIRGFIKLRMGELEESVADYDRSIELMADSGAGPNTDLAEVYRQRSTVLQRLGRHADAIADSGRLIEIRGDQDPLALNHRAYAIAIAGGAGEVGSKELEAGLVDIERAIKIHGVDEPAFIDTRAYLLHLLGRQEEALADMEKAIAATEEEKDRVTTQFSGERQFVRERLQQVDEDLAVMYHHRGLIHEKLGNAEQAEADLKLSIKLGYDPDKGVY